MQIVDLRQVHSRALEGLFQEEARHWMDELRWDYRPSLDLVRKFIDSRALGGYAASENGHLTGYGFYVLEDHKGLIGGLYVSPRSSQRPTTERLLTEMLATLISGFAIICRTYEADGPDADIYSKLREFGLSS